MAKLSVIADHDAPATQRPAPRPIKGAATIRWASPDGYSLWAVEAELDDGATIEWAGTHGEDAIYVLAGELDVIAEHDGRQRRCPTDGAVIVEADVAVTARAVGATRIVHFGSAEETSPSSGLFGAAATSPRGVHVYGPHGAAESGSDGGVRAVWFADGTCATCRAQLLKVTAPPDHGKVKRAHSHSEDEIIYVIAGSISMGSYHLTPNTALCVPGDARYALVDEGFGHTFLNFRRDVSQQVYARGSDPVLETALARGGTLTGDVR